MQPPTTSASSSRILYDVPCTACGDNSSGKHYGVFACDGCAGFFKRSVRRERIYVCKAKIPGSCLMDKSHRNQCRSCRLAKCLEAGMNKDAVQHERGPRNSKIRRQMALYSEDLPSTELGPPITAPIYPVSVLPTPPLRQLRPTTPLRVSNFPHPFTNFNILNFFNTPSVIVSPTPKPQTFPMRCNLLHRDDPGALCESAARLLFVNVNWTKSLVVFESLSLLDRLLLLEESWVELFVLGCAQFLFPIDLNVIFERGWARIDRTFVEILESVLIEIAKIRPDPHEYGYLRMMIVFKTSFHSHDNEGRNTPVDGQTKKLQDLPAVANVQSQVLSVMNFYTATAYPREYTRASQLHHILRLLKTVSGKTIIELFFRNAIGDIMVERIISDMYKSGRIPVIPFSAY